MSMKTLVLMFLMFHLQGRALAVNNCKTYLTYKNFQLVIDYAKWRNIKHVVILEENIKLGCNFKAIRRNLKMFSKNKIYLSLRSSICEAESFRKIKQNVILVIFYNNYCQEDFIEQANKLATIGEAVSWLIILISEQKYVLLDSLRFANFSLDVDFVIAVDTQHTRGGSNSQVLNITSDIMEISGSNNNSLETEKYSDVTPFLMNVEQSYNISKVCPHTSTILNGSYCMLQLYKIRRSYNNSLVVHPLGYWHITTGTRCMRAFLITEKRTNFFKFPIFFGQKNSSQHNVNENVIEEGDNNDNTDMDEFISSFSLILNSSNNTVMYPKIGTKDTNGEWTDLIGAVIKEEVDVGVDTITNSPERGDDMAFTYHIMKHMWSIYIRPQESNDVRDIFLVPFSSRLILAVVGFIAIFVAIMTIHSKIIIRFKEPKIENEGNGLFDSLIWCIGVFAQQGSIRAARSCSGQIIIITSLGFAFLIYNSYSAFITSILSVKGWEITTVEDLLDSNYEIGYTKNSQDELYLRSTNVSQLNQIYLRGYLHNNITNITEGLLKAANGNYAFFASRHIAERELFVICNHRCIYDIAEISVPYKLNYIAFPMSKHSPYKKLINRSIIRLYESGVYKYIYRLLNPQPQQCDELRTYQSAGLPDLTAAFAILLIGHILSVVVVVSECIWKRRNTIMASIRRNFLPSSRPVVKGYYE